MIPFAYAPPPQPAQQVQIVQPTARPCAQAVIPGAGGKAEGPANRRARRAYQAAVLRRIRRSAFPKALRAACPLMVSVANVRAELRGMI